MKFADYIRDKRVCFVGACPNLKNTAYGEQIDSFDIVCKSNGSLFFDSAEYYRDYGARIDVLYTNNQFYRNMKEELVNLHRRKVQYLRMKTCSHVDLHRFSRSVNVEIIRDAMTFVNRSIDGALMGCYLIQDILQYKPKELHVCGIDFFLSKKKVFEHDNYQEYLKDYLPNPIREEGNRINVGKTEDGHSQYENTKFIYDLFMSNPVLSMPENIRELMIGIVSKKLSQS